MKVKKNASQLSKLLQLIFPVGYITSLIALSYSVFVSGYKYYRFDNDELLHAHVVYLLSSGKHMFVDFFSVYTPVFHWFLSPPFMFFGFSWDTIVYSRLLMILLFAIRILVGFFIVRKVYNIFVAASFVPLLLFDAFTLVPSMQIRPDNLMLTSFMIGLGLLMYSWDKRENRHMLFVSGIFLALSVLTLIKIVPSVAIVLAVIIASGIWKKRYASIAVLVAGLCIPILLFAVYFYIQGSLTELLTQILVDARLTNETRFYPLGLGFFYKPDNIHLYGFGGRPVTWIYAWLFPLLAAAGAFQTLKNSLNDKLQNSRHIFGLILVLLAGANWFMLFFVNSVFIQYYLPITWLFAVFAAVVIYELKCAVDDMLRSSHISILVLGGLLIWFTMISMQANFNRSTIDGGQVYDRIRTEWSSIDEHTVVFPDVLFRPSVYAFTYGYFIGEVPIQVRKRFPSIPSVLEDQRVRTLYLDTYGLEHLTPDEQEYITSNYTKTSEASLLWLKNDR